VISHYKKSDEEMVRRKNYELVCEALGMDVEDADD
jgi:hypothetical protein